MQLKGQLFTLDFILGMMIMIAALVAVLVFVPSHKAPFTEDKERLSTLMTEGVPPDWDSSNVVRPGFISEGRFNRTKIDAFAAMPLESQQELLGIASAFTIRFSYNGSVLDLCSTCGEEPASYGSLYVVRRYALLGSNLTTMEVRLYE